MKESEKRLLSEFYELKVEQFVDKKMVEIPLIEEGKPISHALSILDGKTHVWIVKDLEDKELTGVVTRHDVLQILSPPRTVYSVFSLPKLFHHGTKGNVEDVMTKNPITCKSDEKIADVLQKMIRHRIRRLAIVKDGKIDGEITLQQLIHKYYKATQYHPITED